MARQADRHATGPSTLSPLLTGTLALVTLAAVAGEAAAQAGAAISSAAVMRRHKVLAKPVSRLRPRLRSGVIGSSQIFCCGFSRLHDK